MKILEDLITPNFDADQIIPTEEDFQKIADAYTDYKLNGKNAEFIHLPWNMARQIKDIYKAVRRLIVAAVFKWDDLVNELKNACLRLGYSTAELKMLIKYVKDYSTKFDSYYDKYCEPVFNGTYMINQPQNSSGQTNKTPANGTSSAPTTTPTNVKILAKPGATFCRIVVYDPKYGNPGARRHIYLTKKQNGSYRVSIGGATVTSWYNEPFFDSVQQAEDFLKNITRANTRINVLSFDYSITDKPISQYSAVVTDLSDCVLVQSDCGQAWIHKQNQYCVESLQENLEEDIEKHEVLNPVLWNEDNTLKDEVKDKVNEIVDVFVDDIKESGVELKVKDIILLGSNANYNYTKDSDIDIHIIADKASVKCDAKIAEALYGAYRSIFNSKYEINFYEIPVELYIEMEDSPRVSNGVYSIKQDKWINEPKQVEIPDLDTDRFNSLFKMWEDKYLTLIDDYNNGLLEDETEVIDYINEIYEVRKTGLSKEGEYGIPNLIFKEVRNKGYLDNLKDLKNKLISRRLSLEESLNWWEM